MGNDRGKDKRKLKDSVVTKIYKRIMAKNLHLGKQAVFQEKITCLSKVEVETLNRQITLGLIN
jgi:hypothetical protein